jgi:amidophosphoribosyltransferase
MCGLVGLVLGKSHRTQEELSELTGLFTDILVLSEQRGRHATGVARVNADGAYRLYKKVVSSRIFVREEPYREVLESVGNNTTILMGHTRWPTVGDINNPANAQPIRAGEVLGTHNGTITNADHLFHKLRLPRHAEVDSEVIFRMAEAALRTGQIDVRCFIRLVAQCQGQMSALIVARTDPETIIIIKGNKPLEMRYHPDHHAIIYASDGQYLDKVLAENPGWEVMPIPRMTSLIFDVRDLLHPRLFKFRFAAQSAGGGCFV